MRADRERICMNCKRLVHGSPGGPHRGRDIAWHAHCPDCADLVADQMETILSIERPRGMPMEIRRCRWCGAERTCPTGWATRCHICLDDRSSTRLKAAQHQAATTLVNALAQYEQAGWTVIAGDVLGLPWTDEPYAAKSHGTWGRHDACDGIQVMSRGRDECASCPPEPGSRTNRGRATDTHLFYLVRYGRFVKFGRGYPERVRRHLMSGALPVQILAAPHAEVHAAELALKRLHTKDIAQTSAALPISFGTGTEVLPLGKSPDLTIFLPRGTDVTNHFRTTN